METIIIGIDHGYGNIKTAHHCFAAGVIATDKEPVFTSNLLIYNSRYYQIGQGYKAYAPNKAQDMDYYILMLAGIALELSDRHLTEASIRLAAGLPLTWVKEQKEAFKAYLLQNKTVDFTYRRRAYHLEFEDADIYPQGFAAIAPTLWEMKGTNLLADIGNGTMNLLYINDCHPMADKCFTEQFGVHQCEIAIREAVMQQHQQPIDPSVVERFLRTGTADIAPEYLDTMRRTAEQYVADIFYKLQEHGYNPKMMRLTIVGGGGCLVKHFGQYDGNRVTINGDICATAKGYEYLTQRQMKRQGR